MESQKKEFVPRAPDLRGLIQEKAGEGTYRVIGNVSLWKHPDSPYFLRGNIEVRGEKLSISFDARNNPEQAQEQD